MKSNKSLLKYASLATQFFLIIALTLYVGNKIDKWLEFKTPTFTWSLPLIFILGLIIKIVKDTSNKK